jgi:hypothetical protein
MIGKVFFDQNKLATNPKEVGGPCKPISLAHPRPGGCSARAACDLSRRSALVTWVDDHEVKDRDHVYGV